MKDEYPTLVKPRRAEILAAIETACPSPPPLRLRPLRSFYHPGLLHVTPSLTEERITFARDFLDADLLIDVLEKTYVGVWEALCARPRLLAPLLLATNHDDSAVRGNAMAALYDRRLPFDASVLEGRTDAIDALSQRLFDDDDTLCRAGAILGQVGYLAPGFRDRIQQAAQSALTQRAHDLSATGVLEGLGAHQG